VFADHLPQQGDLLLRHFRAEVKSSKQVKGVLEAAGLFSSAQRYLMNVIVQFHNRQAFLFLKAQFAIAGFSSP